jgi:DNA-binding Lrp family transcriptional regulator
MPLAFITIETQSSKTSEDDVLAQLRKMKNVKEAHPIFGVALADPLDGVPANIAAIIESETLDELKMFFSKLGQIQGVRSTSLRFVSSESEAVRMLEAARFPRKSGKPVFQ